MQEKEEEEDKKRNEEFEKNNAEWCNQYLSDIEQRDKATAQKKQNATSNKLRGNKLFKAKKYPEALEKYMEALTLTPYDGAAIVTNIAQTHIKLKQFDDALEFLERAVTIDPKNIKVGACLCISTFYTPFLLLIFILLYLMCMSCRRILAKPLCCRSVSPTDWRRRCSGRRRLTRWTRGTVTRR
jgi:tetratricopeptide (TPR) repeat protein